jgi:hypothetical protein
VLKFGWMAGALRSMPEKAPATPPNDVESLRPKSRAVTSVDLRQQSESAIVVADVYCSDDEEDRL